MTSLPFGRSSAATTHHLDEGVGIDLLERALIARVDFALGVVVEHLEDHPALVLSKCEARRHRCLAHRLAAINGERGGIGDARGGLYSFAHARPTRAEIRPRSRPCALNRSSWLP